MNLNTFINENYPQVIKTPFKVHSYIIDTIINIDISKQNLIDVCDILTSNNINYNIIFGTLLGIYRNGNLIEHDTDIDIAMKYSDSNNMIKLIPLFENIGFKVLRYQGNQVFSIGRNGDYVDFYFFSNYNNRLKCAQYELQHADFNDNNTITLDDNIYKTINDPESFFLKYYGSDWKTPIKNLHASVKNGNR